jgi:ABC-2 type transport system ATP-binding protein
MTDLPVIQTNQLSKSYGRVDAVRELSLSVGSHRITGFLGRNGAGKSTTIKMLLGMIRPTSGEGRVLNWRIDNPSESIELRRHTAFVAEDKRLYGYMSVAETIRFTGGFYPDWRATAADLLLRKFELPADRKVRSLSKGMRTKLALLLALARQPDLLILDEPSEGLDPIGVEQLLEILVAQCSEGTSIFFSSHQIEEVERIADQVCIVERGRLLLDASMDDIRRFSRQIDVGFPFDAAGLDFDLAGVRSVRTNGRQVILLASGNTDEIIERARGYGASSIETSPLRLREVFLSAVQENSNALV